MATSFRNCRRSAGACLAAISILACERPAERAANDTGHIAEPLQDDTSVSAPAPAWIGAAGRQLLVAIGSGDSALVILPEFTADSTLGSVPSGLQNQLATGYDLFAADGSAHPARLTSITTHPAGCAAWPVARLALGAPGRTWAVGLATGRAGAISYSPLERLGGRDSARFVASLARLASTAPDDTTVALRGLPYVVRSAQHAVLPDSQSFVLAELLRRLNVEANPVEERVLVLAERASGEGDFALRYSERHAGLEEQLPVTDLIGLLRLSDGRLVALASREFIDATAYMLFERRAHAWHLRWHSAYAGC